MSKKSTQTTNQTTNATTSATQTPTNPAWVDSGLASLGGQINDLSKADPYSFVAGADPLQTQAGKAAGNLTTSPNFGMGSALVQAGATGGANTYDPATGKASSLLDNLGAYMSPYTDRVVNTTLAGFDQNAGYSRAGDTLARAGDATFGGSGGAIQTALNEQNIARDRAQTEATLRDQAFQTGAGLSAQDAAARQGVTLANMGALNGAGQFNASQRDAALQRLLSGGQTLAGIGQAQGADARANIDTQSSIGSILQQLAQAKAGAPINTLSGLSNIFSGLPLDLLHGGTTTGTQSGTTTGTSTGKESGATLGDWLNYFASNAAAAAKAGG